MSTSAQIFLDHYHHHSHFTILEMWNLRHRVFCQSHTANGRNTFLCADGPAPLSSHYHCAMAYVEHMEAQRHWRNPRTLNDAVSEQPHTLSHFTMQRGNTPPGTAADTRVYSFHG